MTYEYYPLQNTLPFLDLLHVEENLSAEITNNPRTKRCYSSVHDNGCQHDI